MPVIDHLVIYVVRTLVKNGVVTGGDGVTEASLGIPGFHGKVPWGSICHQSGAKYGS